MKFRYIAFCALIVSHLFAGETPSVPIASYPNNGVHRQREGRRIHEILKSNSIESTGAGSAGITVFVEPRRADFTRYLLAKMILEEKLDISLIRLSGDDPSRYIVLSPDEAISRFNEKQTEQDAAANP